MCQFDTRCRVGHHTSPDACPYYSRRGSRSWAAAPPTSPLPHLSRRPAASKPAGAIRPPAKPRRPRSAAPAGGSAVSGADLLVWWVVLALWNRHVDNYWVTAAAITALLPVAIGTWLLSNCTAWLDDDSRRCTHTRRGPFRRCGTPSHKRQRVTAYDLAGCAAFICGVLALASFIFVATR
jgi:hypothetical protein